MSLEQRFWPKVYKTHSCWFWLGACNEKGYGIFNHPIERRAHRLAWFLLKGEWPKQQLLHSCDTPQCVNPDHLHEGTNLENHQDSSRKGINANLSKHFKRYCVRGHRRNAKNISINSEGAHTCRLCNNIRAAMYREKRRGRQALQ